MGPGAGGYSNRFIAMPSYRTRSIGMQWYKYGIRGFLHWGYNFYNNFESDSTVNPFIELSGEAWTPAGDPFVVYPGIGGKVIESLRAEVFYHAIEDNAAMHLAERLCSRDKVIEAIEEILGDEVSITRCAYSSSEMDAVREKINLMIKENIAG